jgi:hypothetical protein
MPTPLIPARFDEMAITSWVTNPANHTTIAAFIGIVLVAASVARAYFVWRRLAHVPGPFLWSLSPFPLLQAQLGGYSWKALSDLSRKHGKSDRLSTFVNDEVDIKPDGLVRIGPNSVITTDYKHLHKMAQHTSPYRRGPWYGTFRFQKGIDHSFSLLDEEKHQALRNKVAPGFANTQLLVSSC